MAIDDSLAKGLQKRVRREQDADMLGKLSRVKSGLQRNDLGIGKISRKNYITKYQTHIRKLAGDSLIDEGCSGSGKSAKGYSLYLVWDDSVDHTGVSASLDLSIMESKHCTQEIRQLPIAITEHALQRIIQAAGMSEIEPGVVQTVRHHLSVASLVLSRIDNTSPYNRFYTEAGVSAWEVITVGSETMHAMKTYIPSKSLDHNHELLWKKYMDSRESMEGACQMESALWSRGKNHDDNEIINWKYGSLFV